jgi:hypothetical protein
MAETGKGRGHRQPACAASFKVGSKTNLSQSYNYPHLAEKSKLLKQVGLAGGELLWQGFIIRRSTADSGRNVTIVQF